MTAEEFAAKHSGDYVELIDGEVLPLEPGGARNGEVCSHLAWEVGTAARRAGGWVVCTNDTFVLTGRNPDRVRGADLVLWRREGPSRRRRDLNPAPPVLVGEVRRPFDTATEMERKAAEYLEAGVTVVLVLDPDTASAAVYRADELPRRFSNGDEVPLADLLPGFAVPVRKFFE